MEIEISDNFSNEFTVFFEGQGYRLGAVERVLLEDGEGVRVMFYLYKEAPATVKGQGPASSPYTQAQDLVQDAYNKGWKHGLDEGMSRIYGPDQQTPAPDCGRVASCLRCGVQRLEEPGTYDTAAQFGDR